MHFRQAALTPAPRRVAFGGALGAWLWLVLAGAVYAQPAPPAERPAPAPESTEPDSAVAPAVAATLTAPAPPPGPSIKGLIRDNKFPEALAAVEAEIKLSPEDDDLRMQRARLLYWLQRFAEAEREVQGVLQRRPNDLEAQELLAQVRLAQDDVRGALTLYEGLQNQGDGRAEIQQRIIDLRLVLDDVAGVERALALGGTLTDEQALLLARIRYPWSVDVGTSLTYLTGVLHARFDGAIGYRFSRRWTFLAGATVDQRVGARDIGGKAELYANFGRLSAMVHVASAPFRILLPGLDLRFDGGYQLTPHIAPALYLRYAGYRDTDVYTVGPNVAFSFAPFTIQPGVLFVWVNEQLLAQRFEQTLFLKLGWQTSARTALFLWTYLGQDATLLERTGKSGRGVTLVAGVDHWFTGRWGTRFSGSASQPIDQGDPHYEASLLLRARF